MLLASEANPYVRHKSSLAFKLQIDIKLKVAGMIHEAVPASCAFPLLASVRALGRYCLPGVELPHVAHSLDALLDDFSSNLTITESYKRTGSLRFMQYIAARRSKEALDPFYRRWTFNIATELAAARGDLAALQWLMESYQPDEFLTKAVAAAAANGHLHILEWLYEQHKERGYWGGTELCGAMENNHKDVVDWLRKHAAPHADSLRKVMEVAATTGTVDVVEWLFKELHESVEDALWSAQSSFQWDTAQWILEHCKLKGPWIDWDLPAKDGALPFLQYLRSRSIGGPGYYTLQVAAWNGHLEVVKWLHYELGVTLTPTLWLAAENGHLDLLQWLHENGCNHGRASVLDSAAAHGHLELAKWLHVFRAEGCSTDAMDGAAANGFLDVVQWLHHNRREGCTTSALNLAAREGHLEIVQWLHTHRHEGCTTAAMNGAAESGHLATVMWLHANRSEGCTTSAMNLASSGGHLDIVKWLHKNRNEGCTSKAMDKAAANGHLELVKWLHTNRSEGCTADAMDKAAANGHLEVVKWLQHHRREGCTGFAMAQAILGAHFEVALFLHSQRTEGFVFHVNTIIKLPLELLQWLVENYAEKLDGCEFEVPNLDWRFNDWCRRINLRLAHQNGLSTWWECD
ncbi:hypothetical protein BBJ28_00021709, partial [Nothophytophthora sp. Chile5]